MKKVKVSIQDEHTLVLQESGEKGDVIDLQTLHETDIDASTIQGVVNSIKKDAFNAEVQKAREQIERELSLEAKLKEQGYADKAKDMLAERDVEIAELRMKLEASETSKELAVTKAVGTVEKERDHLASELRLKDTESQIHASSLKEKYEDELKNKDEMIAYYKDMKAKLSTKMVGETLEQHCEIEFEKLRATAFQHATFGKDNDASSGSKGEYIYSETDE